MLGSNSNPTSAEAGTVGIGLKLVVGLAPAAADDDWALTANAATSGRSSKGSLLELLGAILSRCSTVEATLTKHARDKGGKNCWISWADSCKPEVKNRNEMARSDRPQNTSKATSEKTITSSTSSASSIIT